MAKSRPMKERTVAFYEVVTAESGEQHRVGQFSWDKMLATLSTTGLDDRTFEAESTFVGSTITFDEEDHLLLHRVKSPGEWLSVLNWKTGEWHELESRAEQGYLDTSVAVFLPYGNIVGIMQGATSAPTHKSLQTWLNGLRFFPTTQLVVRPLLSR